MICAECGSRYKRVTWTSRGRKRVVWRCINRLDYGKRYCKSSLTVDEEALHAAIVRAVNRFNEEDVYKRQDSNWLADTVDYTEEISTKLLEQRLRESLTPTQYGIYQACILNGISYKAYADQMGVSYQSVQNAIRLIQKKAKNIFG